MGAGKGRKEAGGEGQENKDITGRWRELLIKEVKNKYRQGKKDEMHIDRHTITHLFLKEGQILIKMKIKLR